MRRLDRDEEDSKNSALNKAKEEKILTDAELEELNDYLENKPRRERRREESENKDTRKRKEKMRKNDASVKNDKKKKKKKKKHIIRKIFLTILILIIIAGGIFGALVAKNGGGLSGFVTTVVGSSKEKVKTLPDLYALVIGVSQNMTDSIMVAKYSPQNQQAALLSIPRDTFVGKSRETATAANKINAVYAFSGAVATMERVNDLTGLNIKNYIVVDTKALRDIVDCLGGVYFDVPIDMNYDDSSQHLAIHLKAGYQLLNGTQAEGLCRFRHNNNGTSYPSSYGDNDFGRMRTQREFIAATLKQAMKPSNITKVDDILKIAQEEVETNIEWSVAKDYIAALMDFNTENIQSAQLPGTTGMLNDYSFFFASDTKTKSVIQEIFLTVEDHSGETPTDENTTDNEVAENGTSDNTTNTTKSDDKATKTIPKNSSVRVEIINGSGVSSKLTTVKEQLTNQGFKVSTTSTTNTVEKTVVVSRNDTYYENAKALHALIGAGTLVKGESKGNADVTIILGKDY